jgi:hypothetical protein
MTIVGWIMMIASLSFVVGLTAWCYWRVLSLPREETKTVKDLHSA